MLQIFDVDALPNGSRFMVSELLDGETLAARLQRVNRLSPEELLPIAQQLLTGLAAAHDARVLHRDLKPDNVFLVRSKAGTQDFVKLIDFGSAKFQHANQEDGLKMTKTGVVVGTPYCLSPEQARGAGEADARSDFVLLRCDLVHEQGDRRCSTTQAPERASPEALRLGPLSSSGAHSSSRPSPSARYAAARAARKLVPRDRRRELTLCRACRPDRA